MNDPQREAIKQALRELSAAADPLDALRAARRARELTEALEVELIAKARGHGASWSKIGAIYGLTKQGAQQRFKRTAQPTDD